jgi:integrase
MPSTGLRSVETGVSSCFPPAQPKIIRAHQTNGTSSLRIRLQFVHEYKDRHCHLRRYFRRRGQRLIPLPGKPGSPEFQIAYNAAIAALTVREIGKAKSAPGSVSAAIAAYYRDYRFLSLAPVTQKNRRAILERFRTQHGEKRLAGLQRAHVAVILGAKRPFAARNWVKALRGLMQYAVAAGLIKSDPTAAFEPAKARPGRIHTWTEEEIVQFEAQHPIGSRARLAMALLLYTGQRRGDVVRMGPQHIRQGVLIVTQQKTGTSLTVPIHPRLAEILAATQCGHLAFLVTAAGAPFSAAGFGNLFREWCDKAGLSQCSAHGLRKAACRRLAEIGCSAPEIAAISGHKSLKEVQRYIEEADQARLAQAAMRRLSGESDPADQEHIKTK